MSRWMGCKSGKRRLWRGWNRCPCCRPLGRRKRGYKKLRSRLIRREGVKECIGKEPEK